MARAGVQKMSLPDIYNMFKTASLEDKAKLMNTYSNLGERLGKRDQDIDYRRTRGDKDALTEKTITEGVGDVFGSAWDYTKQGASKLADYAKQGAGSLRDLVMGAEEQLPVNDTTLPWKAEGNAFVGSRADGDINPLDGGMSRDSGMSLYEPELGEEEVLSPQEQRFLGESAPKKEVAESPMARRMRERLEALNVKQDQYANNPDARWSDLYRIDPERAIFDKGKEAKQVGPTGNKLIEIQQRNEDREVDAEVNMMASDLLTEAVANGWDETDPEYMRRWAEIEAKNATKWKSNDKTVMDKYQKAIIDKRKEEFDIKKQQADAEYRLEQQDMDALKMVVDTSSETFAKAKDVPVQLNKVQGLITEGVENQNYKAIDAAAKILIQSFDNSAVLGNEIGMLANTSLAGQVNSFINKIANGTTYTKEDVRKLWEMAEAIKKQNDLVFDEAAKRSQTTYKSLRGKESPAIDVLFKAYRSMPTSGSPNFDKLPDSFVSQWGKANIKLQSGQGGAQAAATGPDFTND
jgi:hypothetical protein